MTAYVINFALLPFPALFLMLLGLVAWCMHRPRLSVLLFVAGTLTLLVFSTPAVGRCLHALLRDAAPAYANDGAAEVDAVIVMMAGVYRDEGNRWWPKPPSIRRATRGLAIGEQLDRPVVFTGGAPIPGQPAEAVVVAEALGLAEGEVLVEASARNTAESGRAVARLLETTGARRVLLVTDSVHIARAAAVLRHNGLDVSYAATTGTGEVRRNPLVGLVPNNRGLRLTNLALYEYVAIATYLARGEIDLADLSR